MARSFESCVKGMLNNAPVGRSSGPQDSAGCGGCLMVLVAITGIAFIIEFWIPIVVILVLAVVGYVGYRVILALRRLRAVDIDEDRGSMREAELRPTSQAPAGWYPDPLGDHQHRYWDGSIWSEFVADDGVVTIRAL